MSENNKTLPSTEAMINHLKSHALGNHTQMLGLIKANPNYTNRLISLSKTLQTLKIPLTPELACMITRNISHVGSVTSLLESIKETGINLTAPLLERVFKATKVDFVTQHVRTLSQEGLLDLTTFELLLHYPEQSYKISQLIINLQKRAYDSTLLVNKIQTHLPSPKHLNTLIELLNLLLENDLYDANRVDSLLNQNYIDTIYEGAKKLVGNNNLLGHYLELMQENPQNANIFAKTMVLLYDASLIDCHKEDCLILSKLGVGAFYFMENLQQAGRLNAKVYQTICRHNSILAQQQVIESFSQLPLFEQFTQNELEQMLDLITKESSSDDDLNHFLLIIQHHLFINKPSH